MEFVKIGKDKWLIKASNGRIVSDKEKKQLEKKEITIKSETCKECEIKPIKRTKKKKTATSKKELANDTIEETDIVI